MNHFLVLSHVSSEAHTHAASDDAALFAIIVPFLLFFLAFGIIYMILGLIVYWKMLVMAGEKGWKSLIPFYNFYVFSKIGGREAVGYFWWYLGLTLAGIALLWVPFIGSLASVGAIVFSVLVSIHFLQRYSHPSHTAYVLLWILVTPVCLLLLKELRFKPVATPAPPTAPLPPYQSQQSRQTLNDPSDRAPDVPLV